MGKYDGILIVFYNIVNRKHNSLVVTYECTISMNIDYKW